MGTLGVSIVQGPEVGSFGVAYGRNIKDNADAAGIYMNHTILGPMTMGVILLGDKEQVSYALTLGFHW